MSIHERRQREIEELRNTILAHATQIIAQDGYSGFSIRRLALSIDYSPRTIYLYFADKEAILLALVEEAYARTLLHRESHLLSLNPIERVRIQSRNHFHNALAHPEHYRVIVDILNRDGFIPGPRQLELENLVRQDIAFIKAWNPENMLDVALHALFATIRGLSMYLVAHRDGYDTKQLASMIETYVDWISNWLSS